MKHHAIAVRAYQDKPEFHGLRWFQLPADTMCYEYNVEPWDIEEFGENVPHPDAIREIHELHPDQLIIFMDTLHGLVAERAGLTALPIQQSIG